MRLSTKNRRQTLSAAPIKATSVKRAHEPGPVTLLCIAVSVPS
jgi:hypothetical protein